MMRRLAAAAFLTLAVVSPLGAQPDPRGIVDRVDQLLRGTSSRGTVSMQIVTRQWSRALDMDDLVAREATTRSSA